MGTWKHKKKAPKKTRVGIISVSTTRTIANDKSGLWINKQAKKEAHTIVFHQVIPDESSTITKTVLELIQDLKPDVIIVTGGTGISNTDVTIEAVRPLFIKELTGFGSVFAHLSFEEIDSAAILSRATAGIIDKSVLFAIPGSLKACKLACKTLIFPEIGHIVKHLAE
ncbi:MAG: MogA/MoaB family molybdenum cofactor biosynthesis protein [Deltaproteobacteria bacterium]|nr:MogA/MoaB family molybdenum cofactor biosynthesis protein [Deltaproteobacteria bacterium]